MHMYIYIYIYMGRTTPGGLASSDVNGSGRSPSGRGWPKLDQLSLGPSLSTLLYSIRLRY